MTKKIYVTKANGEREIFDVNKLKNSLRRAGAEENIIERIAKKIETELVDGTETTKIYKKAFSMLVKKANISAARYSVRRAILDLGPNGFPFEDYIGEIYRSKGYNVEVGKTVKGLCVIHEIDIVAQNKEELVMAELKFHNNVGVKTDLKVVLYVKARFDDIEKANSYKEVAENKIFKKMVITNTKFSSRAIQYANCAGLTLVGWDYPSKGNIQELIDETGLHPITALTTLNNKEKQNFLQQGIVLCKDLKGGGKNLLSSANISEDKINQILSEVSVLCR